MGHGLKVTDVKVEGISLLVTKRSEFDAVVPRRASTV
jgi:ABC-type transporter MlaC component